MSNGTKVVKRWFNSTIGLRKDACNGRRGM